MNFKGFKEPNPMPMTLTFLKIIIPKKIKKLETKLLGNLSTEIIQDYQDHKIIRPGHDQEIKIYVIPTYLKMKTRNITLIDPSTNYNIFKNIWNSYLRVKKLRAMVASKEMLI